MFGGTVKSQCSTPTKKNRFTFPFKLHGFEIVIFNSFEYKTSLKWLLFRWTCIVQTSNSEIWRGGGDFWEGKGRYKFWTYFCWGHTFWSLNTSLTEDWTELTGKFSWKLFEKLRKKWFLNFVRNYSRKGNFFILSYWKFEQLKTVTENSKVLLNCFQLNIPREQEYRV